MRVQFLIPGNPVGKGRPRFTKSGYAYTPPATKDYEESVRWAYLNEVRKNDGTLAFEAGVPIKASIDAFFQIPKRLNKAQRKEALEGKLLPTQKPDADNIAKIVLDALNGFAYHDDSAVVECVVRKKFGEVGHVTVLLEEVSKDGRCEMD